MAGGEKKPGSPIDSEVMRERPAQNSMTAGTSHWSVSIYRSILSTRSTREKSICWKAISFVEPGESCS